MKSAKLFLAILLFSFTKTFCPVRDDYPTKDEPKTTQTTLKRQESECDLTKRNEKESRELKITKWKIYSVFVTFSFVVSLLKNLNINK